MNLSEAMKIFIGEGGTIHGFRNEDGLWEAQLEIHVNQWKPRTQFYSSTLSVDHNGNFGQFVIYALSMFFWEKLTTETDNLFLNLHKSTWQETGSTCILGIAFRFCKENQLFNAYVSYRKKNSETGFVEISDQDFLKLVCTLKEKYQSDFN